MDRKAEAMAQTEIRRKMLGNGYLALANKDKMCVLKNWPAMTVDEAQIKVWSSQLKWRGSGVRVQSGLAVIDLDVDDAAAVDAIIHALPDTLWDRLKSAPVRYGKGDKEAWFCRIADDEEDFYRMASAGFRRLDEDEAVQRVEIFAKREGGGRQFGVYGAHTIGQDDEIEVEYRWDLGRGLCEVPFADLPVLTRAELVSIAETATVVLIGLGWERDLRFRWCLHLGDSQIA